MQGNLRNYKYAIKGINIKIIMKISKSTLKIQQNLNHMKNHLKKKLSIIQENYYLTTLFFKKKLINKINKSF